MKHLQRFCWMFALICFASMCKADEGSACVNDWRASIRSVVFGPQIVAEVKDVRNFVAYGEDVSLPMEWLCGDFKYKKYAYQVNGFIFLDKVVAEYEKTGDDSLLCIVKSYVADFIRANDHPEKGTWPWYDDAIARRVQRWSYYYQYFGKQWGMDELASLKQSLDMQADVLMDDQYYRPMHNHGMFQDLGLMVYSILVCDDGDRRTQCLDKACDRMLKYFKYVYSDDGVHKEHSPSYEKEIRNVAQQVAELMKSIRPEFSMQLYPYAHKSDLHLAVLTRPDGLLPPIGDSRFLANNVMPPLDVVFKDGGHAIFRKSWFDAPDAATWMMFMAATHGDTHKHSDDLSFLVYHKGDLFVEAGFHNYDFLDEKTAYSYSGYAHNVLCVNDKDFPVKINSKGFRAILPAARKTHITRFDLSTDVKMVSGRQERFPNVIQDRTMRYDKKRQVIEIEDELLAKENLKATLVFHLDPEIMAEEEAGKVLLRRSGQIQSFVNVFSDCPFSIKLVSGSGKPPYKTWIFSSGVVKTGTLILVDADCKPGKNVIRTVITLL